MSGCPLFLEKVISTKMKTIPVTPTSLLLTLAVALSAAVSCEAAKPIPVAATSSPRVVSSFDRNWRFAMGDSTGADTSSFDDSKWRVVDVPHDWMIEGQANPDPTKTGPVEGPFDKIVSGGCGRRLSQRRSCLVPQNLHGSIVRQGQTRDDLVRRGLSECGCVLKRSTPWLPSVWLH